MSAGVTNNKKDEKIPLAGAVKKSTEENKTGSWRSEKPVIITEKCTGCGICVMFCPDDCILLAERKDKSKFKKSAKIDYDYCKGCMICINQCPVNAIKKEREK